MQSTSPTYGYDTLIALERLDTMNKKDTSFIFLL